MVDHVFDAEIGEYFNSENLCAMTERDLDRCIELPFEPIYKGYRNIANKYPEMAIYAAVADSHYIQMVRITDWLCVIKLRNLSNHFAIWKPKVRQDSNADNVVGEPIESYQNLVLVQADSQSRGLVIYQSLDIVDEFWPVQMLQHWSKAAFETEPHGIQYYPSKRTNPPCWEIVDGEWVKTDANCDSPHEPEL